MIVLFDKNQYTINRTVYVISENARALMATLKICDRLLRIFGMAY